MPWTTLCSYSDLQEGFGRFVEVGDLQLAVFLHEGRTYVMDNHCPHAGGSMAGGYVRDGCAVCPWHHWAFQLETGQLRNTTRVGLGVYPSRVEEVEGRRLVQAELPAAA